VFCDLQNFVFPSDGPPERLAFSADWFVPAPFRQDAGDLFYFFVDKTFLKTVWPEWCFFLGIAVL
jgi:hypothetical protein